MAFLLQSGGVSQATSGFTKCQQVGVELVLVCVREAGIDLQADIPVFDVGTVIERAELIGGVQVELGLSCDRAASVVLKSGRVTPHGVVVAMCHHYKRRHENGRHP